MSDEERAGTVSAQTQDSKAQNAAQEPGSYVEEVPARSGAEIVGLDPRQLLARHAHGDPVAFGDLLNMYRARVYTYLIRCGIGPSSRDDVFQEIFIAISRNATRYDPARPLTPWIFTIVANCARTHYRRMVVRRAVAEKPLKNETAREPIPSEAHEAKETARQVEADILNLPYEQREVVVLHCIKGLEQKDVALVLNLPVNTVKTHLRRARMALAQAMARRHAIHEREVSE